MQFETAAQVRKDLTLPADGRKALPDLARIERIFREVLEPSVPSYDVNSVQDIDFDEWTYTEGLHSFMAFTQSIEINVRIAKSAAAWTGPIVCDYSAAEFMDAFRDKWELAPAASARDKKLWFPPGNNIGWIINTDNVLRAFGTDERWMLKPHPITSDDDIQAAKLAFGISRLYDRNASGLSLLKDAEAVGYTTASEMGLLAMLLSKPTADFTLYEYEGWGRYYSLYRAVRESNETPATVINRLFNCPWSGFLPLSIDDAAARERLSKYKRETINLRDGFRPLTRPLPPPA